MKKTFIFAGQKITKREDFTWEIIQEEVRLRLNNRADEFVTKGGTMTNEILQKMLDEVTESVIADIDAWARQVE